MTVQTRLSFILFLVLLLIQPGSNTIQQYQLSPGTPIVRAAPFPLPTEAVIPIRKPQTIFPSLTAQAAIVIDTESGAILYSKNADVQLYPASITKMMTAVLVLENYPLEKTITVQDESEALGNTMHLRHGEIITVENLLKGLLIASGNDAAFALADAYPTGYQGFVDRMNERAHQWNMENTVFRNVSGVEQEGHLTTARDLATLAKEAMKNEFFRETVKTQALDIHDITGQETHHLISTNQLLGKVGGVEGIKTGWTTQAGECLITQTTRDGRTIITVVLNSGDRFGESTVLIDWAFGGHVWEKTRSIF